MRVHRLSASRTRRRFEISIGRNFIRYERVTDKASARPPAYAQLAYSRRPVFSPILIGMVGGGMLLAGVLLAATQSGRAGGVLRSPVSSMPVPDAIHTPPKKSGKHVRRLSAVARPVLAAPAVGDAADMPETGADGTAPGAVLSYTNRDQAMRAAFETGVMQQWRDDSRQLRGFVVVGLPERAAPNCRIIAVLTRGGPEDEVERFRHCSGSKMPMPAE
jgi:hypothetical protein